MRWRSSAVANSTTIRPLDRPISTRTRVSSRSESRAARSVAKVGVPLRGCPADGTLTPVDDTDRDELRRLALWLSRRRAVDEAVAVLTAYGPAASGRVHSHIEALRSLLELERTAFEAVCSAAPQPNTEAKIPSIIITTPVTMMAKKVLRAPSVTTRCSAVALS